jgi:Tfp pilus assembly protein PilF
VAGAVGNTDQPKRYTLAGTVRATIDSAGEEPAVARYRELRAARFPDHYVSEVLLNDLGYEYLEQGKLAAAIAVFRITVEQFPESSNAYDSLGEAYLKNGQRELARQNYQRSLDLDPGNENAAKVLAQLRTTP